MSPEIAQLIQLVLIPLLGVVGFVGIRIFKAIDRLYGKIDDFRADFDRRFGEVNMRVGLHAERLSRLEAFHALDLHQRMQNNSVSPED
ncbi:MAG: hypothetical protein KJO69_02840 [Gammaproteobacteria bacterium]|nr:hypothetical protein [Gammaproteobacteria bacterium]